MITIGGLVAIFVYLVCCLGFYKVSGVVYSNKGMDVSKTSTMLLAVFWPLMIVGALMVEGIKK